MSFVTEEAAAETPAVSATYPARTPLSRARELVGRIDRVLIAFVVLGVVVRFWGLGTQSLWYDEWLTTRATAGGLPDLVKHVTEREGIAPTYFMLMWGWVQLFGDGETALRTVSALAGAATVPVAYAIALEFARRRTVARVAALLVAVNPMLVWYSQEARPYAVVAFLGALSLLGFARVWKRDRPRDLMLWGLASAGAVAFHYFAIFLVLAEAVSLLVIRRRGWRTVFAACAPTAVVLAALAPFAISQRTQAPNYEWISIFPLMDRVREAGRTALVGPSPLHNRLWIVSAIVLAIAPLLLVLRRSDGNARSVAALTAGIGAAAVALPLMLTVFGIDVFLSRYLIVALVPLVVAVAVCLAAPRASWTRWVGGTGVAVLTAVSLAAIVAVARDPVLQKSDWRSVARAFGTGNPNRLLLLNKDGQLSSPLLYYLDDFRPLRNDEAISVNEIDVLTAKVTTKPCNLWVGKPCSMIYLGIDLPEEVASQFSIKTQLDLPQFTIYRFIASVPVQVTKSQLLPPTALDSRIMVPAN